MSLNNKNERESPAMFTEAPSLIMMEKIRQKTQLLKISGSADFLV